MYAIHPDRWSDGDPNLNNINGTHFEYDPAQKSFRFGGDATGIQSKLDYIQSMGIKAILIVGTPFYNLPWNYDGLSVIDYTLLDRHLGDITAWRNLVEDAYARGIYLIVDVSSCTCTTDPSSPSRP